MSSRFATLERRISGSVDRMYGERVRLSPRKRGEFVSQSVDPARPVRIVVAVVDFMPVAALPKDTSRFDGMQPMVAADSSIVSFDEAVFEPKADWPKQGDAIETLDRAENVTMSVAAVEPDGLGRVLCKVMVSS